MSNGKGSSRRGSDPESRKRYAAGWDAIFGKPKNTKRARVSQKRLKPYPYQVCHPCGITASKGRTRGGCSSLWTGNCHACGEVTTVTEARDYCYPAFPGCEPRP